MKINFYLPEKSLNDATIYYTELIKKAFNENNFEIKSFSNTNFKYNNSDFFFTIRVRDFINLYKKTRSKKIIMWFQGISPEEYLMINNYSFKSKFIYYIFSILERITLKISYFNFFVSNKMKEHYSEKYNQKIDNDCIIPCYNKHLNKEYFKSEIKKELSFVYAGSLYSWQCFEKTVQLYKEIERKDSKASLTILTKEIDEAKVILKKYKVKNYNVLYVSLDALDAELSKYQYGFLIRDNHPINNVSTPTKMNSYLAVGLIPIYTDVIYSFNENLNLLNFEIKFTFKQNIVDVANKIIENSKHINYNDFYDICAKNFLEYYDDSFNILKIKNNLIDKIEIDYK